MRILVGIHYFPPHMGGMENVAKTQATLLAEAGHDVAVLTSAAPGPSGESQEGGYTLRRIRVWNFFERAMGVPFPFFAPSLIWTSLRMVRRADVVHIHDVFYQTSFAVAFWAWVFKKPVIVTQHVDMIPHPSFLVRFVQRLVYRTTGYFVLSTSKRIAVLNSNVHAFLLGLGIPKSKIVFMPNGVDFTTFHPDDTIDKAKVRRRHGLPLDVPVALFVGRFVPKKGFHKMLEATSDTYHVALAGGTAPDGTAPSKRLTFLGSVSPKELAELYNAVDMFVLPSEGEGFPLTVQEAMASRLPIVISHNPGYDIYKLDAALFRQITPDVEEIKTVLNDLAKNKPLRKKMGDYSYAYAKEHFSWQSNIAHLIALFEEVR